MISWIQLGMLISKAKSRNQRFGDTWTWNCMLLKPENIEHKCFFGREKSVLHRWKRDRSI